MLSCRGSNSCGNCTADMRIQYGVFETTMGQTYEGGSNTVGREIQPRCQLSFTRQWFIMSTSVSCTWQTQSHRRYPPACNLTKMCHKNATKQIKYECFTAIALLFCSYYLIYFNSPPIVLQQHQPHHPTPKISWDAGKIVVSTTWYQ